MKNRPLYQAADNGFGEDQLADRFEEMDPDKDLVEYDPNFKDQLKEPRVKRKAVDDDEEG
jgi:hypothetical protein